MNDWRDPREHAMEAAGLMSDPDPSPETVAHAQAHAVTALALTFTHQDGALVSVMPR